MDAIASKREAQLRVDQIRDFRHYLDELARQGALVLSAEQRGRLDQHLDQTLQDLAQHFDVDVTESQKQISLGMRIISALGGLALCAAVFLFFYRFWGLVSTPTQVALLVAAPVVALIAAEFAAVREKTLYYAALLGLVAFAAFIMNLTVLGTIFNVTPSPRAFLAWGAFALILAYQHRLRLPLLAGLVCAVAYLATTVASWRGSHWLSFGERPENFIPAGLILLTLPWRVPHRSLPEFASVYRWIGLLAVLLPVLILGIDGELSYFPMRADHVKTMYQLLGFAGAGLTIWLGIRHHLTDVVNLGAGFFTLLLFVKFVQWWWDWMPKYLFFLIVGVIALGLLALFRKLRKQTGEVSR